MATEPEQRVRFDLIRYANCWEDADILCEALAPAPGRRLLSIASGGGYTLEPGQSQEVVVRFVPTTLGDYIAAIGFTGGGGTNAIVTGNATGGKANAVMGCGAETDAPAGKSDLLVIFGLFALVLQAAR